MGLFGAKKLKEEDYYFHNGIEFESKTQEDFAPESFTFRHLYVPAVQLMASDWFDAEAVTAREIFKDSKALDVDIFFPPVAEGDVIGGMLGDLRVQKSLLDTQSKFQGCERINWGDSDIARRWQRNLESKGMTLNLIPSPQDHSINIIQGNWKLFDDVTPFPILGEAWRDKKSGKEFVYWFFDALVRTRALKKLDELHPSHAYYYPAMFQHLGYISETIFPSSMVRMRDRVGEFGVEDASQLPALAFHRQSDYFVLTLHNGENELIGRTSWSPETTRYGYLIDENVPFETHEEITVQLVNAFPKVCSILMDGYANWNTNEEICFQDELFHDFFIRTDYEDREYEVGISVPGPAYGFLAWRSVVSYDFLSRMQLDSSIWKVPENHQFYKNGLNILMKAGIGPAVVHAANSLHFEVLSEGNPSAIPSGGRELISRVLTYFSDWKFDYQGANALSNLSIFQAAWGDYAGALKSIERGISLFQHELDPMLNTEMSGSGANPFYPSIIKWELLLNKGKYLIATGKSDKAAAPIATFVMEAKEMGYKGEDLREAERLLETL